VKESALPAAEVNTMLFTSTELEMPISVWQERVKVALSAGPFGGPPSVQLLGFSQAES
jgi:hypothetical protein